VSELDGLLAKEAGLPKLQHLLKAAVADTLRLGRLLLHGLDIDLHAQLVLHFIIVQTPRKVNITAGSCSATARTPYSLARTPLRKPGRLGSIAPVHPRNGSGGSEEGLSRCGEETAMEERWAGRVWAAWSRVYSGDVSGEY
jgi:hypothetical protein